MKRLTIPFPHYYYVVATLHPLRSTMHMQCKYDVEKNEYNINSKYRQHEYNIESIQY
jgi:hypothetical protein